MDIYVATKINEYYEDGITFYVFYNEEDFKKSHWISDLYVPSDNVSIAHNIIELQKLISGKNIVKEVIYSAAEMEDIYES